MLSDGVQGIKMFPGDVVSALRLCQRHRGSIQIFSWQRALLIEILATAVEFLLGIQFLLRRLYIQLSLLYFFRQRSAYTGFILCLRLIVSAAIIGGRSL